MAMSGFQPSLLPLFVKSSTHMLPPTVTCPVWNLNLESQIRHCFTVAQTHLHNNGYENDNENNFRDSRFALLSNEHYCNLMGWGIQENGGT